MRRFLFCFSGFLSLLLAVGVCGETTLFAQANGKTAPKPLFRDPVYDGAADPVLVWNRGAKKWHMFYTNRRANVRDLSKVSWVHGTHIGIAASTDEGATWKYEGVADIQYGKYDY